jgi:molybdenum cofactor biosynthesis enzyme MoaA
VSLKEILKNGDIDLLHETMKSIIKNKPVGHSFNDLNKITEKKEMNEIGG